MSLPSSRRLGLAVVLVFGTVVAGIPHVVASPLARQDAAVCTEHTFIAYESAERPAELNFSEQGVGHYRNLTATRQALIERGAASPEEPLRVNRSTWVAGVGRTSFEDGELPDDRMPHVVAYNGSVYRTGFLLDGCPLITGVPVAFNPVIEFFLTLHTFVTGPLAPLLGVAGVLALAWWAGRKLEY